MVKQIIAFVASASAADVTLATFGPSDATYRTWRQQNDPVMGGASSGKFTVSDGLGTMEGTCAIIPRLKVPGFIKTSTSASFADVSSCTGIELEVRSETAYTGYRFDFGNDASSCGKFFARGYKAPFTAPVGEFGKVQIPFNEFSRCWDDGSGEILKSCADDPSQCPTQARLQDLQAMSIWAEGIEGDVKIDVKSVGAYGCGVSVASAADVTLESFDSAVHTWSSQNDPVMGGQSTSTFTINGGVGTLNGTCAIVPSLSAPGFITARTSDKVKFPDISSCQGLTLTTRSQSTPANYEGYRVSFGSDSAFLQCGKFFARGFKADFTAGEGEYKTVQIPFDMFTKCWDDATGDAVKACKDFPQFCPTSTRLQDLQTLSIWAEGKEADVKLDIKEIGAYGCSADALV